MSIRKVDFHVVKTLAGLQTISWFSPPKVITFVSEKVVILFSGTRVRTVREALKPLIESGLLVYRREGDWMGYFLLPSWWQTGQAEQVVKDSEQAGISQLREYRIAMAGMMPQMPFPTLESVDIDFPPKNPPRPA